MNKKFIMFNNYLAAYKALRKGRVCKKCGGGFWNQEPHDVYIGFYSSFDENGMCTECHNQKVIDRYNPVHAALSAFRATKFISGFRSVFAEKEIPDSKKVPVSHTVKILPVTINKITIVDNDKD